MSIIEPQFTEPYRQCKKCGDTLKRDDNHICRGESAPLNLGTVDDLITTGAYEVEGL